VALRVCVAVAVLNAVAWAVITPTFQVPDELVHVGYVQYLAETGDLPTPTSVTGTIASEEIAVGAAVIPFSTAAKPTWSSAADKRAERELQRPMDRTERKSGGYVASNPPLYYALAAIPYRVAESASLYDRILAMRLLSAFFAGLLAVFVFLFLRELMPAYPLGATVGTLGVVLHPLTGFMAGGVSPEILVWVVCAAIFWLLARAFRRGLTLHSGLVLGLVIAAGLLTKLSVLTLVPGLVVAFALLVLAAPRGRRRRPAFLGAAAALACAAVIPQVWATLSDALFGQPAAGGAAAAATVTSNAGNVRELLTYIWQFYLPRLPFMTDQFTAYPQYPLWETYFHGFVGRFGWFEYGFPGWVNQIGLAVSACILAAAGASLIHCRAAVRRRWAELFAYTAIAASVALLVNVAGYRYRHDTGDNFEQTRYLFPLLPLYAALLALAARAVAVRYRAQAAALLILALAAHNVFAQFLSVYRYYL